jgi:phosphohistidine phosphatase
MKKIYLVRHAKSSWKFPELDDFERPLNNRGRKDAPLMGDLLKESKIFPGLIITSPASRAASTSRIVADCIGYPLEKIEYNANLYGPSNITFFNIVKKVDEAINELMLFGHNPELTVFANSLSDYYISNIPTCGILCIEFSVTAWKDIKEKKGKFKFFEYPKKYYTDTMNS